MTGKWQPLDVMVNNVFKSHMKAEYAKWRNENESFTQSSYLRKPGWQNFIGMVSRAWYKVDPLIIKKSFVKAEIIGADQITVVSGEERVGVPTDEDSEFETLFDDQIVGTDEGSDQMEISFHNEESFIGEAEEMDSNL
ncbi:hypothetical protein BV898_12226 [Hypsibius exemplaris]|uniref:DDE-1 domain-containing protein n=1 Tax=Hypsibius exemplaris TaxID=2072580 RepID=A0A1W0WEH5_HYPEX|nr:hypothetical protein BV898_12226 [Hypsibius exemplaris]